MFCGRAAGNGLRLGRFVMLPKPLSAPGKKNAWGKAVFLMVWALPLLCGWPVRSAAADDASRLLRGSLFLSAQDKQPDPPPKEAEPKVTDIPEEVVKKYKLDT